MLIQNNVRSSGQTAVSQNFGQLYGLYGYTNRPSIHLYSHAETASQHEQREWKTTVKRNGKKHTRDIITARLHSSSNVSIIGTTQSTWTCERLNFIPPLQTECIPTSHLPIIISCILQSKRIQLIVMVVVKFYRPVNVSPMTGDLMGVRSSVQLGSYAVCHRQIRCSA